MDLGFVQAWSMWLSGVKLEDYTMYGVPMLWWARGGKLLQFAGGAVVILDLLGPEWFEERAQRMKSKGRLGMVATVFVAAVIGSLFAPVSAPVASLLPEPAMPWASVVGAAIGLPLGLLVQAKGRLIASWIARLLRLGRHQDVWKWVAFGLVCLGFGFDLLGS